MTPNQVKPKTSEPLFRAECWEGEDFVITGVGGVHGSCLSRREAELVVKYLNELTPIAITQATEQLEKERDALKDDKLVIFGQLQKSRQQFEEEKKAFTVERELTKELATKLEEVKKERDAAIRERETASVQWDQWRKDLALANEAREKAENGSAMVELRNKLALQKELREKADKANAEMRKTLELVPVDDFQCPPACVGLGCHCWKNRVKKALFSSAGSSYVPVEELKAANELLSQAEKIFDDQAIGQDSPVRTYYFREELSAHLAKGKDGGR
jgi:hypothetical protein